MKRIAKLRKEKGLNQIGLAMKLNVSQKMISAYESGIHQPSIDTLIRLSDIFDVSVDYLIENSDIRFKADNLVESTNEVELDMMDLFKKLDKNKQQQAIGILFALHHYKSDI